MLIVCKSCKKLVDTNKHDFCPKCGANFNYSDGLNGGTRSIDYEEYEHNRQAHQHHEHQSQPSHGATLRAQQYETKRRLRAQADKNQEKKNGCGGCLAVVVIIIAVIADFFSGGVEELFENIFSDSEYSDSFSEIGGYVDDYIDEETEGFFPEETTADYEESNEETEDYGDGLITVGINEFVVIDRYIFGCDEIREGGVSSYEPAEGNMFVTFHFEISSVHDDVAYLFSYPQLYADGVDVGFVALSDEPLFMPGELEPDETYMGYMTYEVPVDTQVFEIIYDEQVRIVINNHLSMQ